MPSPSRLTRMFLLLVMSTHLSARPRAVSAFEHETFPSTSSTTLNVADARGLELAQIAGRDCFTRTLCSARSFVAVSLNCANTSTTRCHDASACHADSDQCGMPEVRYCQENRQTQLLRSRRYLVQELWRCWQREI